MWSGYKVLYNRERNTYRSVKRPTIVTNYMDLQQALNQQMDSNLNIANKTNVNYVGDVLNYDNPTYTSGWTFWRDYYYPQVIRESYPVYVQEKAKDKGKQAFEIVKILKDKKLIKLERVSDFIDVMDELIKIL